MGTKPSFNINNKVKTTRSRSRDLGPVLSPINDSVSVAEGVSVCMCVCVSGVKLCPRFLIVFTGHQLELEGGCVVVAGGEGGGGSSLETQDFTGDKATTGHLRNTCSCEVPHRPQQTGHGGNGRTETAGEGA